MTKIRKQNKTRLPVVGVPTCRHQIGELDYDCTQHKYLKALYTSAKVLPLQIPLFAERIEVDAILDNIDGLMLTGSHSNVHPRHYEATTEKPDFMLDTERDATVLRLIRPAVERGIPLLAICRGFQELNVAYGGTLHSRLDLVGSFNEHREDKSLALELRYNNAHSVNLVSGGQLNKMLDLEFIEVNSLHGQGINKLGEDLFVEGRAEDGLVEAVSVKGSDSFAIGVQWHPEWKSTENAVSSVLFSEFGKACLKATS
ncbi:MAG: putative glutamine amidotransferase [Planctomycetota bacterium]|jgi:putative glutamine amidotransferase